MEGAESHGGQKSFRFISSVLLGLFALALYSMASGIQSSLSSAREKALLGQYDDALTFFDGVVADVQVLLRSCEPKDKSQWLMFKEKVQEEATLVKDISSVINCFKDQPGRVSERGVSSSRRPDAEASQFFADKDVNSFPSRPQVHKQAAPAPAVAAPRAVRAAEYNPEQRCVIPSAPFHTHHVSLCFRSF
jgi:hypothetical protein